MGIFSKKEDVPDDLERVDRRSILKGAAALTAGVAIGGTVLPLVNSPSASAATGAPILTAKAAATRTYGEDIAICVPAHLLMWKTAAQRKKVLDDVVATGAKWVRTDIWLNSLSWDGPNQIDWKVVDEVVDDLARRGLKTLFVVQTLPRYAGVKSERTGPTTNAQRKIYTDFMVKAVHRYKNKVKHWEIWNEPNLEFFWGKNPRASDYDKLLRAVYPAIKREDPSAVVITAGLGGANPTSTDVDAIAYLKELYRLGGIKKNSNGVATHAYANMRALNLGEFGRLDQYRKIMDANGDKTKKLWVTEAGAPYIPGNRYATEANQTGMMPQIFNVWKGLHDMGPLCWFALYDVEQGANHGLFKSDNVTKRPAFYTMQYLASQKR